MSDQPHPGPTPAARLPWRRNLLIWAALLALLFLSLGAAFLPLGRLGTVAGLGIAAVKAALVAALFMELDQAPALVRIAAAAGCVFALVMFSLTFSDVLTRP